MSRQQMLRGFICNDAAPGRVREKKTDKPQHEYPVCPVCVCRKRSSVSSLTCQYPLSVFGGQGLPSLRVADGVKGLKQEGPEASAQRTNLLPERLAVTEQREEKNGKGCATAQANQQLLEEPFTMATNTPPSSLPPSLCPSLPLRLCCRILLSCVEQNQ